MFSKIEKYILVATGKSHFGQANPQKPLV